jgi:hypothetical protein
MPAECCTGQRRRPTEGRGRVARERAASSLGLALGLALAFLPKCPLCVVAYLSLFGVGMAAASALAPWLGPLALGLVAASALVLARSLRHARRQAATTS